MIIAHHIILTGYGHWLPNDPRGSLSREFRKPELKNLGEIHFGRKDVQPPIEELKAFYAQAKEYLKHGLIWFDAAKRQAVGEAFGQMIRHEGLTCYVCGVMRNHAHLLVRRHRMRHDEMIRGLTDASRDALVVSGIVPSGHPVWSEDPFVVFKDTVHAIHTCIAYISGNFRKHRIPEQHWDFVTPYDDWPFHNRPTPAS